jgi:hypothetical protein
MAMPTGIPEAPPTLDLRRTTAQASASGFEPGIAYADPSSVLVDGLALADEISRAALRIAAATRPKAAEGEEG